MAARAKKRAAYGLLALVAVKVASSAPSPSVEAARYLPSQKGQLHQGKAQIVNLHGCETRLRTTPMGEGRARLHLLSHVGLREQRRDVHGVFRRHGPRVALQPRRAVPGGSWAPRPGRMQGPELPLTDEHVLSPPFP